MDLVTITNLELNGLNKFLWNDHSVGDAILTFLDKNSNFNDWKFEDGEIRSNSLKLTIEWKVEKITVI